MVDAATNKLCHRASTRLKELATDPRGNDYVEALTDLFDLPSLNAGPEEPDPGSDADEGPVAPRSSEARAQTEDDGE